MKISLNNNQFNFGKKLAATCNLQRRNNRKVDCNIFQLNLKEDKDYFEKLQKSKSWQDAWYVWDMDEEFNSDVTGQRTFVLESQAGRCLGYIAIMTDFDDDTKEEIVYLETCPKYQTKQKERSLKYIGETLMSFAIGMLDKNKTKSVVITAYSQDGEPFYIKNCGFKECDDENRTLLLKRKDFKKLLARNEIHTDSKIRYVI